MKWEYLQIVIEPGFVENLHAKLNEYGADGWELVSTFDIQDFGFFERAPSTKKIVLIFKRPIV